MRTRCAKRLEEQLGRSLARAARRQRTIGQQNRMLTVIPVVWPLHEFLVVAVVSTLAVAHLGEARSSPNACCHCRACHSSQPPQTISQRLARCATTPEHAPAARCRATAAHCARRPLRAAPANRAIPIANAEKQQHKKNGTRMSKTRAHWHATQLVRGGRQSARPRPRRPSLGGVSANRPARQRPPSARRRPQSRP